MASQDDFIRTALRVPPSLHAKIHEAARAANRTFNAELVARLEQSFDSAPLSVDEAVRKFNDATARLEELFAHSNFFEGDEVTAIVMTDPHKDLLPLQIHRTKRRKAP